MPPEPIQPPQATAVAVHPAQVRLVALDATVQLTAEVRDQNGRVMSGAVVTWSSSNAAVASVDATGLVTAANNGTATITATAGTATGSAAVRVEQEPIALLLSPAAVILQALGDTLRLVAEAVDANGNPIKVSWSSNDTAVARIDDAGLLTAVSNGTATVTAVAGSATANTDVLVKQEAVVLQLTPEAVVFRALGDTLRLMAEAADANGHPVDVSWSSSDTAIANVDAVGLLTAVGNGTAIVTATVGGANVKAMVTVEQELVALAGLPATDTLLWYGEPTDTLRLPAKAVDANGHSVQGVAVEWSSSLDRIAIVDADGLVKGVGEGVTAITATAETLRATTQLAVVNRDRAALAALYHATGGVHWDRNANWLTSPRMRDWQGVTVEVRDDGVVMVTGLWLPKNNLTGTIPPELWTLTSLERLVLTGGTYSGTLPPEIGNLTVLRELHLSSFSGTIPPEIGRLAKLEQLNLQHGDLTGTVPSELGRLVGLKSLALNSNRLGGPIPPEIGQLGELGSLVLGNNAFVGTIPPWLGSLTNLIDLSLNGNRLTGPIPSELGNLARLKWLGLGNNGLTGPIPPWLGSLDNLTHLSLSDNRLTGPIPPELRGLASLDWLLLDRNVLTGPIPPWLGSLENLTYLSLGDNRFTGPIPSELANLDRLGILGLDNNLLTGPIPPWLGSLRRLDYLFLHENEFTGPVPPEIGDLANLAQLHFEGNALTGQIPNALLQLGDLRVFRWLQTTHPGDLCVPDTASFRTWLADIGETLGPLCATATGADASWW